MEYLKPDIIWESFGANSETEFIEKFVLEARFHNDVPKEIVNDYKTVEKLQYFSYYHYPIIDEAFSKAVKIFESSITLLTSTEGDPKKGFVSLSDKIKRIKSNYPSGLVAEWEKIRTLRNYIAHQQSGSLMGITLLNAFKHNLNMINSIFLPIDLIDKRETRFNDLSEKSNHLNDGLFVFNYNQLKILVKGTKVFAVDISENKQSLWVFIPIIGDINIEKTSDFPPSFILRLENVTINQDGLKATEAFSNYEVSMVKTSILENISKYDSHIDKISRLEKTRPEISSIYMMNLNHKIGLAISAFLYDNWEMHYR